MRATATALYFLVLNLVALGIGPWFTGKAIDLFSRYLFTQSAQGDFAALCPGGIALDGSAPALVEAVGHALANGTRYGLVLTLLVFAWASLHYLLAARTLERDLRSASSRG